MSECLFDGDSELGVEIEAADNQIGELFIVDKAEDFVVDGRADFRDDDSHFPAFELLEKKVSVKEHRALRLGVGQRSERISLADGKHFAHCFLRSFVVEKLPSGDELVQSASESPDVDCFRQLVPEDGLGGSVVQRNRLVVFFEGLVDEEGSFEINHLEAERRLVFEEDTSGGDFAMHDFGVFEELQAFQDVSGEKGENFSADFEPGFELVIRERGAEQLGKNAEVFLVRVR